MRWCPHCVQLRSKETLDAARKEFVAKGGLTPTEYDRNAQWNTARLKYCAAREDFNRVWRREKQRREREREWDRAHQEHVCQYVPMAVGPQGLARCLICASTMAADTQAMPKVHVAMNLAWWEKPGGLAVDHRPDPEPQRRQHSRVQVPTHRGASSPVLQGMIKSSRVWLSAAIAEHDVAMTRWKTECAHRKKVIGDLPVHPMYWESPVPAWAALLNFQNNQESARSQGRKLWQKPSHSPLAQSEQSDELEVDNDLLATMREKENLERVERSAVRVAEEVGYLYFVGEVDGVEEWKEDIWRSNQSLVVRSQNHDFEDFKDEVEDDEEDYYEELEYLDIEDLEDEEL